MKEVCQVAENENDKMKNIIERTQVGFIAT